MAVAAWLAYLCVHFVLVPGWFVWRYRRSPYALRWLPRSGYEVGESAYGWLVIGYTVAVLFGTQTEPRSPGSLALACVIAGSGLILSAVATLGSNWRDWPGQRAGHDLRVRRRGPVSGWCAVRFTSA